MHYGNIKYLDIANGPGVRTVLFVSGCRNKCKNCFQPETWDFKYGQEFDKSVEDEIIKSMEPYYVSGITLLGGDPMEPENQAGLIPFLKRFKKECPDKTIWGFTGYILDKDLVPGGRKYTDCTDEFLSYLDVLVDGPFIEEQKSLLLKFRGSANQRLIDMKEYNKTHKITMWSE